MFSFVRAGAVLAGVALAGLATAPAFATGDQGDPAGNNGTVKIIKHGNIDDIPNNEPHVGCTLDVEWYGFDEGEDVISKINFELHAPTLTGELSVEGPAEVNVGADAASGAGTEDGFDARQAYTLSSTGLAHPKQGFHVKVTIHTPRSKGNDTKTKVFWFQNCETEEPTEEPTPTPSESAPVEEPTEEPTEATPVADEPEPAEETPSAAPVAEDDSAVPTNIDAGLAGESDSPVPAMWPLLAMLAGAAAAGAALLVVLRRRAAALVRND
ncbi:MAG: hypothetical protein ACRDPS_15880 [Nocardioides sp.]|uniref:hypothetical protein n=1 Tax=Nocardioides sp. TaxID=35761 RepID=UPI003D6A61FD